MFVESRSVQRLIAYYLFSFETSHNQHLVISKQTKKFTVSYFSLDRFRSAEEQRERTWFVKIQSNVLRGPNLLLRAIKTDGQLPGTPEDFSGKTAPNGWERLFTKTELRGMIEKTYTRSLHNVLAIMAVFIDQSTEYETKEHMRRVRMCDSELFLV